MDSMASEGHHRPSFRLLDEWGNIDRAARLAKKAKAKMSYRNIDLIKAATTMSAGLSPEDEDEDLRCSVINPCSMKRACWDMMSLFMVTYDMAVLPLQFFEPDPSKVTDSMTWITRLYWTFDMPMSFFTGFLLPDGSIEMHVLTI